MAVIPGKRLCDFCGNEIGAYFTQISVPLPPSVRQELVAHIERTITPRYQSSPLGLMMPVDAMVQRVWPLEQCLGCTIGLMPDVIEKIREQCRAEIDRKIAAQRQADSVLADLDAPE